MTITPLEMHYQMFPSQRPEERQIVKHSNPSDYSVTEIWALKRKRLYLKNLLKDAEYWAWRVDKMILHTPEKDRDLLYIISRERNNLVEKHKRSIGFVNKQIRYLNKGDKNIEAPRVDMEEIRNIPMIDVLNGYGFRPNAQGWYSCPLHREKTASFHIIPGKNRYKCFGCGDSGSVIDLVVKVDNSTIADAIKKLLAYIR